MYGIYIDDRMHTCTYFYVRFLRLLPSTGTLADTVILMEEETGTTSRVPPRRTRVGIVQKFSDTDSGSYRGSGEASLERREPTRDAFLALHRAVLRIPSSVELSASSRASSQESLANPTAVARWSERFEEAFQSEESLDNTLDGPQEEEIDKRRRASAKVLNGHGLPPSESNTPILNMLSPDCRSITSESLTGFEFAMMNSNRTTLDHSATNGKAEGKATRREDSVVSYLYNILIARTAQPFIYVEVFQESRNL